MPNTLLNRTLIAIKTNKSGGAHAQGDVCVEDTSNANAVVNNTAGAYNSSAVWVCVDPNGVANDASGTYASAGYIPKINLSGSASLGDLFKTHTVAKQAVRHAAPFVSGDFGQVLGTGTTPAAWLFGKPDQGSGASVVDDTAYDATSWNGDTTHAPSKNAVRDKIESMGAGITMDQADPYGIHHRLSGSHSDDDEFSSDTSANYTEVDPTGTTTWLIGTHHVASCIFNGQAAQDYGCLLKAMTLADNEWFETHVRVTTKIANYTAVGIIITDGTVAGSNGISGQVLSGSGVEVLGECYKGTVTTMGSTVIASTSLFGRDAFAGIKIKLLRSSATSFQVSFSLPGGAQFSTFGLSAGAPGFTPTHAGIFVSVYGGGHTAIAQFDYLRHMA